MLRLFLVLLLLGPSSCFLPSPSLPLKVRLQTTSIAVMILVMTNEDDMMTKIMTPTRVRMNRGERGGNRG